MKATRGWSVFKPTNTAVITVLLMLISPVCWSLSGVTVLCLEGNGDITVEKQHFNGENPSGALHHTGNTCNSTNHILLADICSANESYWTIDIPPPQIQLDIIHFSAVLSVKELVSPAPLLNSSLNPDQILNAIRTLVLLI